MALTDNLISFFEFESGAILVDAVGAANNLTDVNTVTSVTGKVGNGSHFVSSSSQTLKHASNTSLQMGDIDFSIALWIKIVSAGGGVQQCFVSKWNGATDNREYMVEINDTTVAKAEFRVSNNGVAVKTAVTTASISSGTYGFVVAYHDSVNNLIGVSLNGAAAQTASHTTGVLAGSAEFRVGSLGTDAAFLNGDLDQVGIWKRVLSSAEITTLYNSGNGLSYAAMGVVSLPLPLSTMSWF